MKWQPIETAPTGTERILITGKYANGVRYVEESFRHYDGHYDSRRLEPPTHWMPLPKPPEETRHEDGSQARHARRLASIQAGSAPKHGLDIRSIVEDRLGRRAHPQRRARKAYGMAAQVEMDGPEANVGG